MENIRREGYVTITIDLAEVDALFTDLPMESALLDKYQSHTDIIW